MVWSVVVSMASGCGFGAQKEVSADEVRTTSRAKDVQGKVGEAKLGRAKSEEPPLPG